MNKQTFYAKSQDGQLVFSNKKFLDDFLFRNKNKEFEVSIKRITKMRTDQQNRGLHLYYTLLADELNNAGYSVQLVLKEKVDLDWTYSMVKELLWRPAQQAILGVNSTTELDKVSDITTIWEHLNRHISEKFGIHCPFPVDELAQASKNNYHK